MPRTPTLPPTEPAMWRKLIARTPPDAGGDHELFIWAKQLHDIVGGEPVRENPPPRQSSTWRFTGSPKHPTLALLSHHPWHSRSGA